jgi:5-methylcytosine-specific restriction endonuclease McrA
MAKRSFGPSTRKTTPSSGQSSRLTEVSTSDFVKQLKEQARRARPYLEEYRRRSLEIHGNICAKCGREFSGKELRLLTVHHKDGNHHNNPQDGSNWENLCVHCHDDEHSREILAEYLSHEGEASGVAPSGEADGSATASGGFNTLQEALEKALKKNK